MSSCAPFLGFANGRCGGILWQLDMLKDKELHNVGKGTMFPNFTSAHHVVFTKGGYRHIEKILNKYKMAQSHSRFIDPK